MDAAGGLIPLLCLIGEVSSRICPTLSNAMKPPLVSACLKLQIAGLKNEAQKTNIKKAHSVAGSGSPCGFSNLLIKRSPTAR